MTDRLRATASPWLLRSGCADAPVRLVCFAHAGGSARFFRDWRHRLPASVDILAVQLPGREERSDEPPATCYRPLAESVAVALQSFLERPVFFFGHSMGALLAFETARCLRRLGLPAPRHLFVSGLRAPALPRRMPALHALPAPAFRAQLRALGGTPSAVLDHDELLQALLPTLRADFAVCETYSYLPDQPLPCAITAIGGRDDGLVNQAELEAWRWETQAPFAVWRFPGNHFYLNQSTGLFAALSATVNLDGFVG